MPSPILKPASLSAMCFAGLWAAILSTVLAVARDEPVALSAGLALAGGLGGPLLLLLWRCVRLAGVLGQRPVQYMPRQTVVREVREVTPYLDILSGQLGGALEEAHRSVE